jgi:small subunit ribosomal protein S20
LAEHKSVKKRHRQSVKANLANRAIKSTIKSKTRALAETEGIPEGAKKLTELTSLLDKAVKRNILHKKTASRKKSRLAKILNKKAAAK